MGRIMQSRLTCALAVFALCGCVSERERRLGVTGTRVSRIDVASRLEVLHERNAASGSEPSRRRQIREHERVLPLATPIEVRLAREILVLL